MTACLKANIETVQLQIKTENTHMKSGRIQQEHLQVEAENIRGHKNEEHLHTGQSIKGNSNMFFHLSHPKRFCSW